MIQLKRFFVTIRSRLYLGFTLLVLLFVVNGIITLHFINKNKKLSDRITHLIDPTAYSLKEFRHLVVESKMFSANWVFVRSNNDDKVALQKLHMQRYPAIEQQLKTLTPQVFDSRMVDTLNHIHQDVEILFLVHRQIMASLNNFDAYDDLVKKMEMELLVEEEVFPRTTHILAAIDYVMMAEQKQREEANAELAASSSFLRASLLFMTLLVLITAIFFSIYLVSIITKPITQLIHIITNMGNGVLEYVKEKYPDNEIGIMAASVNRLSYNLRASADFANEVGNRNFDVKFEPLSDHDLLGKALVAMRDNLQKSDHRLKQAQSIAKIGSWELNLLSGEVSWSDEMYVILGYQPGEVEARFRTFMELVVEDDRIRIKGLLNSPEVLAERVHLECRILSNDLKLKDIIVQWQQVTGVNGTPQSIVGIIQDVTYQKLAEERQRHLAEVQKVNRELDKFVYSVSHDLRAPLSSMLGIVQITEEDCEDEFIKQNLTMVKGSIHKLDGFIKDILDYSRNARTEVKKVEIDFDELLKDIIENLKYMDGADDRVKISVNIRQQAMLRSDKSRLKIILSNILSNAIRYRNQEATNPYVNVEISAGQQGTDIRISDNGIGIKQEMHEKIFEMFYRVSENSVGTGLGLYIVKEAVHILNGTIKVESEQGRGTTFIINIPNQ